MGEAIALEREREEREIKAAVDEAKQWVEGELETAERRLENGGADGATGRLAAADWKIPDLDDK
jgi:hypothetical protein